jgi:hypothetical protein
MTLEEQIRPHTQYWDCYNDEPLVYNHTGKVLKITHNFAIGFAEWFWINKDKFYKGERDYYLEFKELLEIYKKEKGL